MPVPEGTRLGPYEVVSPLGAGGMGEVYRARHLKLGRDAAVKVLPAEFASDPGRRRRFEREARAASALNHPNIVTIHDIDEQDGIPYIAMELVEGRTLRQLLRNGPLPLGRLLDLSRQVAEGLARAHSERIVHRDLKPENIMVTDEGLAKILDFGLAKHAAPEAGPDLSHVTTVERETGLGMVVGTVPYMSPEQAAGRPVDFRSDQFSFGSILYEMATARPAFKRDTAPQTLAAVIEGAPEPLGRLVPSLPQAFVAIVERCLAKDPEQRFESTRDLAAALQAVPGTPAVSRTRRLVLWTAGTLLTLGLAWLLLPSPRHLRQSRASGAAALGIRALAVLPLQNLSGHADQDYFADGMTEALITDLAKVGALKVISRSSTLRYKGAHAPVADIAKTLGVDAVVEGSAQRVGDRVRITAQLIEPRTERVLWADSYDRGVSDVLRLQGEIAQAVTREIGTVVTVEESQRLSKRRDVDPEALEAYFKGVFHTQRFTPQDLDSALLFFEKALAVDPGYAAAQVGIAEVWSARMQAGLVAPREAAPRALAAVQKALSLDPELSEAHVELANLRAWYEWDWAVGEAEYRRALELNPSDAHAHGHYAHLLTVLGRFGEGTEEMDRAQQLDPLNPLVQVMSGLQLIFGGRFDDGIARLRTTFENTPGLGIGHIPLWAALDHQGRHEEALQALKEYYGTEQRAPDVVRAIDQGHVEGGYKGALRRAAQELERRSRSTSVGAINVVDLYDRAGDKDKAFEWLERAYQSHDPNMPYISVIPFSADLMEDPRFPDMLRRLNLADQHALSRAARAGAAF